MKSFNLIKNSSKKTESRKQDRQLATVCLTKIVDISNGTIGTIINDYLGLHRISAISVF